MKKFLSILIAFVCVIACTFSITACDDADPPVVSLTEEELIDFHYNGANYPENPIFEGLYSYCEVIGSASSREEAVSIVEKRCSGINETVEENKLMLETDLFYELYAKWFYQSEEMSEPYYYERYLISFKKDVYDRKNRQFITRDKEDIKSVIDYISYSMYGKVHSSYIARKGDKYEYTSYLLIKIGGDWGMMDQLTLFRVEVEIDLSTGKFTHKHEEVQKAFIDGALTNF